jgi:hypothetical protein
MPQGSISVPFLINELMLVVFSYIPLLNGSPAESSLLNAPSEDKLLQVKFYFDDIFRGHKSVKEAVLFLETKFLPRIA